MTKRLLLHIVEQIQTSSQWKTS